MYIKVAYFPKRGIHVYMYINMQTSTGKSLNSNKAGLWLYMELLAFQAESVRVGAVTGELIIPCTATDLLWSQHIPL